MPRDTDAIPDTPPVCAFGTPWPHNPRCAGCRAFAAQLARGFAADVAAGRFNARGYTRAEWAMAGQAPETWASPPPRPRPRRKRV